MAIARTGSTIGAISGALGAVVYAQTKQGLVIKHRPLKIKKHTDPLLKSQALLKHMQREWGRIWAQPRAAWRRFAETQFTTNRLGVRSHPSGYTLFVQYGIRQMFITGTYLEDPPIVRHPDPLGEITFDFRAGNRYWILTDHIGPALETNVHIWGTRTFKTYPSQAFRTWTWIKWEFEDLGYMNIEGAWETALGPTVEGEFVGLKIVTSYKNYWHSAPRIFSVEVTAPA